MNATIKKVEPTCWACFFLLWLYRRKLIPFRDGVLPLGILTIRFHCTVHFLFRNE